MKFIIKPSSRMREIAEHWDFRRLLNQVCCPTNVQAGTSASEFGAMFFFAGEEEPLSAEISSFRSTCEIPPFIVTDLENGPGEMIHGSQRFPQMMGFGQADSTELVYEIGKSTALLAGACGFNWNFSPVVDLAVHPDSPVVSGRSAGQRSEQVIKIAGAYMRGLQDTGMMATIKHFPGDGSDTYDQHLTTPVNPLSMEEWHDGPGRVFKELIEAGAMAVMPGHIALPAYDKPDERGLYPPATVSRPLLQDLLRGELDFQGLIVSDAVNMGGLVGYMNYYDACAAALESGCDMLLFPHIDERFYVEMERRHAEGKLSRETLLDRASRVLSLKEQMGLMAGNLPEHTRPNRVEMAQLAERVTKESLTLVRDREGLVPFPLRRGMRVLHVVIMNKADQYRDLYARIHAELERYCDNVDQWVDPGPDKLFHAAISGTYDLILCSIGSRQDYGLNVARLHGEVARNMMGGWMRLGTPVIFVSHFHPFVHKEYEAPIDTLINTYGDIEFTARLLIDAIAGQFEIRRQLSAHD
ncbi:glycoside hydrolase family 3 protein [Cohnella abietis]|uniref:beta-N-acetylhexosaminidase n=1 Tax=Cohnella abietis TaxID=2507935 RepID=A0A3T1D3U8_9BACL|nr:glycoside hydrolase family 3 N-terminal domain-containing protein [Cohnella abietis]BBI32796.1 beta-hexosaminidase [Cohnella abietis]